YFIVQRRGPNRAQADGVRCQVESARVQCGLQLDEPIASIAIPLENWIEVRQVVAIDMRVGGVVLEKREAPRLLSELPGLEKFDGFGARMTQVRAWLEALHSVDNEIVVVQWRCIWGQ